MLCTFHHTRITFLNFGISMCKNSASCFVEHSLMSTLINTPHCVCIVPYGHWSVRQRLRCMINQQGAFVRGGLHCFVERIYVFTTAA